MDTGVREGDEVSVHYDPMLAKVIAWGTDRLEAIDRLRAALEAIEVDGIRTNTRFLWEILGAAPVRTGDVSTRLLETTLQPVGMTDADRTTAWLIGAAAALSAPQAGSAPAAAAGSPWAGAAGFRLNGPATVRLPLRLDEERRWLRASPVGRDFAIEYDGHRHLVESRLGPDGVLSARIDGEPASARLEETVDGFVLRRQCLRFDFRADTGAEHHASAEHEGHLRAPMPGLVLDVRAVEGATVEAGAVLVVLEAMKMEHSFSAPWRGTVSTVSVKPGDRVQEGSELVLLEPVQVD